jgi:hypothetical protein
MLPSKSVTAWVTLSQLMLWLVYLPLLMPAACLEVIIISHSDHVVHHPIGITAVSQYK